ncbi:response regulator transcription factor [Paenibacillus macerans]|uniref:response regulator transcription factor n=1 Tax=Paenibacillus macerans TaxID=44252 RepID=UPI003D314B14
MSELCRLLIVDDELLVRQGIKHHLNWEQHGFRIVGEASNGREALELMDRLSPHIVITDIVMPVMDGEEFTRVLKAHYPRVEVIVLSSYGEFDYVRSTFQSGVADYILKPKLETKELLQVLQKTALKIPGLVLQETPDGVLPVDRLLERLLAGYEPEEGGERLADRFPHDGFLLAGADLGRGAGDWDSYMTGLADGLQELPFPVATQTISTGGNRLLLLANLPGGHMAEATSAVHRFALARSQAVPEMVWAVSGGFTELRKLGEIYREEWQKLLSYRFYFPDRIVLRADELPPAPALQPFDMKELAAELKKGQIMTAFGRLRDYAAKAAENYRQSPFEFKSFLGNAVFTVTIIIADIQHDVKELDEMKYAYFKAIDEAADAAGAVKALRAFLGEAEKLASARLPQSGDGNMKKLLEYIDEHYGEPLSLSLLSRHFHFNPSYLSSYFSAHNDEGFSEYLNKIRISQAAALLRSDGLSISEISGRVGYSDHSYFTKVFKKHTGMSPSEYRRQSLGKRG